MPQLDVSTYLPQIVWLAITFTALYVLMASLGLPRVGAILAQRRDRIGDDFDRAEKLKAEAEAIRTAYERALAEARAGAQETVRQTMEMLHAEAAEQRRETARELQEQIAVAERRIAAARAATLVDLRSVAAEAARATARKLTGVNVGADEAGAAVDAILHEYA